MNVEIINPLLTRKYNQPVPRYTSYPTVPFWQDELDVVSWKQNFQKHFNEQNYENGISLYIHLPFCESLCTYCGCNKKITTNHKVEDEYLLAIEEEWKLYRKLMQQTPVIRSLHLGGGTPTFFSPFNLRRLLDLILKKSIVHPDHEFSIEGHPNNTTAEHLKMLYSLGFRRISYGVQDNDPEVQRLINRIQPFENVKKATETARSIGFNSVNFDLIYGLPGQTTESIERTMNQVISIKPDRIAFYSYAHVPWTSRGQRLFDETNLPSAEEKIQLYLTGRRLLMSSGYVEIGMDHFALSHDELCKAKENGELYRNFMGYTTRHTKLLLGLGVSSISATPDAFAQNEKTLHEYYAAIGEGKPAVKRGYLLTEEDIEFHKYILDISCRGQTDFNEKNLPVLKEYTFPKLKALEKDGLIEWNEKGLKLKPQGYFFIRNICSAFDLKLSQQKGTSEKVFSKGI
jgi:oxygen-independent coproporphyrinogen-3 oxidase